MIEKSPDEIYELFKDWSCVKLSFQEDVIWFMWLYNYGSIHEAGSLCIWKQFRNLGLWSILQKILLEKFSHVPIFLVTNVDKVRSISEATGLIETERDGVSSKVLEIIEQWWKLLRDDILYYNKTLFFNEAWYHLTIQTWIQ